MPIAPTVTTTVLVTPFSTTVTVERDPSVCTAELGTVSTSSTLPMVIDTDAPEPVYSVELTGSSAIVTGKAVVLLVVDVDLSIPMVATVPVSGVSTPSTRTDAC